MSSSSHTGVLRDILLLMRLRWTMTSSVVRQVFRESRFKAGVILVLALVFWAGFFWVFLDGFRYVSDYEGISSVVHDVLFALFFVSLLIMLTFSNTIICFSSFFRSREMESLLSSPISLSSVIFYKFTESIMFSSWAFVLMALPFLFAYGFSVEADIRYYPAIFLFFPPFVVIPGSLGVLLAVALTVLFPRNRGRVLGLLIVVTMIAFTILGLNLTDWRPGHTVMDFKWMNSVLGKLAFAQNAFLPSQWMSRGLIAGAAGVFSETWFSLALLISTAAFLYALLDGTCCRWLRSCHASAQESGGRSVRRGSLGTFRFAATPGQMILLKDLKVFIRDPVQWSQCVILFGVLAIYFLNLRSLRYNLTEELWKNMVAFLNLSATCLTLATLTTRFVFPMISLEGLRFWVLGLTPVSRWQILRTKFMFVLVGSFIITQILTITSNVMLGTTGSTLILQCVAAAMVCVGLSGLTVGLGVVFPNFKESDPSKIVSGFGGTLTLVLSMLYVAAFVAAGVVPCHYCLVSETFSHLLYWPVMIGSIAAGSLLTAAACVIPLWLGHRNFSRLEI